MKPYKYTYCSCIIHPTYKKGKIMYLFIYKFSWQYFSVILVEFEGILYFSKATFLISNSAFHQQRTRAFSYFLWYNHSITHIHTYKAVFRSQIFITFLSPTFLSFLSYSVVVFSFVDSNPVGYCYYDYYYSVAPVAVVR